MPTLEIGTTWVWEHWLSGRLFNSWRDKNLFVLEGRNEILDVFFTGGTQLSAFYIAPFEDNHTPASGDNYATPGFTECTAYEGATRPGWTPGAVSGGVVDNSANRASFTFNDSKTIYGAALVGGGSTPSTKDDQSGGGVLFCASQFSASEPVINGSVLKVLVELTLSAA